MSDIFTADDLTEGADHKSLGPAYFASRRIVRDFVEKFTDEQFKPLIDDFCRELTEKFAGKLWDDVRDHLWSDTESNLQGKMWRMVDQIVLGLLGGERWVMERYVLGDRYDCDKVRALVARYVCSELQDARVADLEAENERLRKSLEWVRR